MSSLPMTNEEIKDAKMRLRQFRVSQNFEIKYREKGGIAQLQRMIKANDTVQDMANWFGIAQSRMSVILESVLGIPYSEYLAGNNISRSGVRHE